VSKICQFDGSQVAEKIINANFWKLSRVQKTDKKGALEYPSTNVFFAFAAAFKYIGIIVQKV